MPEQAAQKQAPQTFEQKVIQSFKNVGKEFFWICLVVGIGWGFRLLLP